MPKKTRKSAEQVAKNLGIPKSHVTKTNKGYFIAPAGITSSIAKRVYVDSRAKGKSKEYSARVAWSIQKGSK